MHILTVIYAISIEMKILTFINLLYINVMNSVIFGEYNNMVAKQSTSNVVYPLFDITVN